MLSKSAIRVADVAARLQKGEMPGAGSGYVHKYGRDPAIANGTWGGVLQAAVDFPWLTTATTVRIKAGGNAADTAAGLGAQSVKVEGLDETGAEASELIVTAGASASTSTTTTFIRVFRMYVVDSGAYGAANTAAIIIENTAGTADLILIAAAEGQSQFAAYTIPLGHTGYLTSPYVQADGLKAADFRLMTRADCLTTTAPTTAPRVKHYFDGVLGLAKVEPNAPLLELPALTDVWIDALGSGAGTEGSAGFEILLVASDG